ncbi:MAG: hypothetical protein L6306_01270 [Planctomycetales bacterium]|nr:hypothetical protein [Planctomycetales bacterium]
MSERDELLDVEAAIDKARKTLDATEAVYRQAQAVFVAECKPLWARREALLCNADEWQEDNTDE